MKRNQGLPFPAMPSDGGYSAQNYDADTLDETDLDGSTLTRAAGMYEANVSGTLSAGVFAAGEEVRLALQVSNDGTNWTRVAITALGDGFTANGQTRTINADSSALVNVGRFRYLRTELVLVGTPTFTGSFLVAGTGRGGTVSNLSFDVPARTGATTSTAAQGRIFGSRVCSAQCVLNSITSPGAPANYITVALQGSPDGGTTWIDIGTRNFDTALQARYLRKNGSEDLDMGAYTDLRVQVTETGTVTAYDLDVFVSMDTNDYALLDESSQALPDVLNTTLVRIRPIAVGTEVGNVIPVTFQVEKFDGSPLISARRFELTLYDSTHAGSLDLSTNGTFDGITAAGPGTALSAVGSNRIAVETDANGLVQVDVRDVAAETIYIVARDGETDKAAAMVIAEAGQQALVFA